MYIKDIINDILKLIPNNIKNNMINKMLEELFINELDNNMDYEIILNEDIYNKLNINDPNINSFPENEKNFLIELQLIGSKNITYTIANFNIKSNIELRITTEDKGIFTEKSISLQINNKTNNSEIITQVVEKDNYDYYYNYDYQIYRYNHEYKRINENIEEDINKNFHEIFHVPLGTCNIYRNNFKRYSKYLNREKIKYEMQESDKQYNNKDSYVFDGPYNGIEELRETLKEEMLLDEDMEETDIDLSYTRIDNIIDNIMDKIIENINNNNLLRNITHNSEFILSFNLYDNIYKHSKNKSNDILYTTGTIIFKEQDKYILCGIHIENYEIITFPIPEKISEQILNKIYNKTENNEEDEDLQDFFGYNDGFNKRK